MLISTKLLLNGYQEGVFIADVFYLSPQIAIAKGIIGAVIRGGANSAFQYMNMAPDSEFSYYSATVVAGGYLAPGYNISGNTLINMGGAFMTDEPRLFGQGSTIAGSLAGETFGKYAPDLLAPYAGSASGVLGDIGVALAFESINDRAKNIVDKKEENNEKKNDFKNFHFLVFLSFYCIFSVRYCSKNCNWVYCFR